METRDPCPSPRIAAAPRWSGAHRRHRWPQWPWPGGDCWLGRARPGDHGPHAESRPAGGSGGRAVDGTPHPGQGTAALTLPVTGRLRRPPGGLTAAWWLSAPPRGRARGPRRAGVCVTVGHGQASGSAVVPGLPAPVSARRRRSLPRPGVGFARRCPQRPAVSPPAPCTGDSAGTGRAASRWQPARLCCGRACQRPSHTLCTRVLHSTNVHACMAACAHAYAHIHTCTHNTCAHTCAGSAHIPAHSVHVTDEHTYAQT